MVDLGWLEDSLHWVDDDPLPLNSVKGSPWMSFMLLRDQEKMRILSDQEAELIEEVNTDEWMCHIG
jgi:hypothetical protein